MQLRFQPYALHFIHPFGVSGNTRTSTISVFVEIGDGDVKGYGEACLPPYLGETEAATVAFLHAARPLIHSASSGANFTELLLRIDQLQQGCNAAKAALDMALNDLAAKQKGVPLRRYKALPEVASKPTSFTIGIDTEEVVVQKIKASADFQILKIKAGTGHDKELISLIRKHTNQPLYVDVNQGWTNKHMALEMMQWMADKNVVLVEQPMPKEQLADMRWLTQHSPLPTFADESVKRLSDLEQLDGAFNGINIKLMKCTGVNEALKMIQYCRNHHLQVFLGCMAESTCGTSAMAQLMGLADYIDLDAPQLYKNDPFTGLAYAHGKIHLGQGAGTGATPLPGLFGNL
jgi:L-alanine-DL-glutamate epimerase-like enolase superfamily enzyme